MVKNNNIIFETYSDNSENPGTFEIYCEGPDGNPMLVDRNLDNVLGKTDIIDAIKSFSFHFSLHEKEAPEKRFNFTSTITKNNLDTTGLEALKNYLPSVPFIAGELNLSRNPHASIT